MTCKLCADHEEEGALNERERIIKLLESIETYPPDWDYNDQIGSVIALIKDETRMIRSEILPNGLILIEEIKGENK
jgi:hypothetical protein